MKDEQAAEWAIQEQRMYIPSLQSIAAAENNCPLLGTVQLKLQWHISRYTLQGEKALEDHGTSSTDESKFDCKQDLFHFGFVPSITALTMSPFSDY